MTCLQHRYIAHPNLQRWLYCELCGLGKEIGAETKARTAATPSRPRRKTPSQLPLNFTNGSNEILANEYEAQALRLMREAGLTVGETVEETVDRYRERQPVPPEAYETDIATDTSFSG